MKTKKEQIFKELKERKIMRDGTVKSDGRTFLEILHDAINEQKSC